MGVKNFLLTLSMFVAFGCIGFKFLYPELDYKDGIKLALLHARRLYAEAQNLMEKPPCVMTKEELKHYTGGEGSKGLYLAILGRVYDVSKGSKHYAPDGGYAFFAGRDGSRAFVTGEFNDAGLTDIIDDFSPGQMLGLRDWLTMYDKDYAFVCLLEGNFYSSHGLPTQAYAAYEAGVLQAQVEKSHDSADSKLYPGCNSEWSQSDGGRVWCSNKSGGVDREWTGVPRLYHRPGKTTRCACIRSSGPAAGEKTGKRGDLDNPNFSVYERCHKMSPSCDIVKDIKS